MQGNIPSIAEIVALQNDICSAGDLREPVNLREQLVHSSGLSSEVGHAIAEMLQVCTLQTTIQSHSPSNTTCSGYQELD